MMTNHALLNNIDHKDLRVITDRSAALGDNVMYAISFPFEFRNIQADYPIFFFEEPGKDQMHAVALFGFARGENLFLSNHGWDANYVPLAIERQPFLIGFEAAANGDANRVVHVDLDSPRLSTKDGERLFLEHGGTTPYLARIASLLEAIHEGGKQSKAFIAMLKEYALLEPFSLDIELRDGSKNRLVGFHTIHEDKLAALDGPALRRLHENGFLLPLFMAVASLSHIGDLVRRKNRLLADQ